ncbi:S26 family signal peptidase [Actinoplanes sp. CA-030573]|uniref:S26 family signal peptidase n=1 Tax=Actinoplanes sp. CA-030573 TaxID=3239898 RepID=UPI003D8A7B1B
MLALLCGSIFILILPMLWGWTTVVVVSGSMLPTVHPGDVVSAAPVEDRARGKLALGTVVLVNDPAEQGRLLMHRLVDYTSDGAMVLQGDSNALPDTDSVPISDLVGVARLRVPAIGLPFLWIKQRKFGSAVVAIAFFSALVAWQPKGTKPDSKRPFKPTAKIMRPDVTRSRAAKKEARVPMLASGK